MQRIEDLMNWLTDRDWSWWPVVSLRPDKATEIDTWRLLKMSGAFAAIPGLVFVWFSVKPDPTLPAGPVAFYLLLGYVLFFVLYRVTFAHCWNRRARRLSDGNAN